MHTVSEKKLKAFFAVFPKKSFFKQQVIIGGARAPKEIMYIQQGYVRQYIISPNGEEETIMIYGPSDIFSLVWGILNRERQYRYLEAMTPVTVHYCSAELFRKCLLTDAKTGYAVLEQTLKRLDDFIQNMAYVSLAQKAPIKVLSYLLLLSQRFGSEKSGHFLPFVLTHKDIAGSIGLSRETVSIALKKLIDSGIVIQKEHVLGIALRKRKNTYLVQVEDLLK